MSVKSVSRYLSALALLVACSCDQPQIAVESDESVIQTVLISHDADSVSVLGEGLRGRVGDHLPSDSAFEITYKRFENINGVNLLVELFDISLTHRLEGDTTLDYGSVTFGGSQLHKSQKSQNPVGATYSNLSMLVNLSNDSSYSIWLDSFRLEQHLFFTAANSPVIKDFEQEIPTQEPNRLLSPINGQSVSSANDMEIVFQRAITKHSTITIGCVGSGFYYHFELLKSATKIKFPAEFLRAIKDTSANAEYQVAFEEKLDIGSLTSEDKVSGVQYRIPIFQYSIGSIKIRLSE